MDGGGAKHIIVKHKMTTVTLLTLISSGNQTVEFPAAKKAPWSSKESLLNNTFSFLVQITSLSPGPLEPRGGNTSGSAGSTYCSVPMASLNKPKWAYGQNAFIK